MARALPVRFGPHAQQFPEGELDDLLLKPRTAAQPLDPTGEHAALLAALPGPLLQLMQDWLLDDFSVWPWWGVPGPTAAPEHAERLGSGLVGRW